MSSGRAMQSTRIGAPVESSAMCSMRRGTSLAPLDVVEDDDERLLRRRVLERLAERPGDLVRGRGARRSGRAGADRRRGEYRSTGPVELLEHLDDRPVADPLPVREATAARDRRRAEPRNLRGEPRLADAGLTDDGDQLAARSAAARSHASRSTPVRARGRRTAPRGAAPGRRAPPAAGTPGQARALPFSRAAGPPPRRPRRGRAPVSVRRSGSRRRRRLLEPCGDVDGVAGREALRCP